MFIFIKWVPYRQHTVRFCGFLIHSNNLLINVVRPFTFIMVDIVGFIPTISVSVFIAIVLYFVIPPPISLSSLVELRILDNCI